MNGGQAERCRSCRASCEGCVVRIREDMSRAAPMDDRQAVRVVVRIGRKSP